jgi:Tfp pilus assembly major pilin PilA
MNNQPSNSKGFGLAGVLIVVAVVVVLGGVGGYIYHHDHEAKSTDNTTVAKNTSSASSTQTRSSSNSEQTSTPAISVSAATQLLNNFYNQYLGFEKADPPQTTETSQLVSQDGTAALVGYYTPKTGYSYYENPIVCAQGLPSSISVTNVSSTSTAATATIVETFGKSSSDISAKVVSQSGNLKIDSITCNPPLVAQQGGE